jgi:NADPH:quinone reductase-like Zn-dependent oxidoreductase
LIISLISIKIQFMQALPTVQKALVLKQAGSPVVFEEVPVPVPNQDQVLIRVDSAPINPSDIGSLRGTYPGRSYPSTPGNEGAGVVVSEGLVYPHYD